MHLQTLATALLACAGSSLAAPTKTTKPFSTWMASSWLSKGQKLNNHYVMAVIHEGIQKAATTQNDTELLEYAHNAVSSLVTENGTLKGMLEVAQRRSTRSPPKD
jgi:hypothetical protein